MDRKTIETLLRTAMTSLGVFMLGKNLLGTAIDASVWQMVVGTAVSLLAVVWGVLDKNLGIEMLQSFIRSAFVGFGGLLVAKGQLSAGTLESVIGVITAILPAIYSFLSRKKSQEIAKGAIIVEALKK